VYVARKTGHLGIQRRKADGRDPPFQRIGQMASNLAPPAGATKIEPTRYIWPALLFVGRAVCPRRAVRDGE